MCRQWVKAVSERASSWRRLFQSVQAVNAGCSECAGSSRVCRPFVQAVQECAGCSRVCRLLQSVQSVLERVGSGCWLLQSGQAVGAG